VSELKLVTKGERVGSSEAALLQKLDIRPFTYGLKLRDVYDNGSIFSAAVMDITEGDLKAKFSNACRRIASIGLAAGYPTLCSLPHSIGNGVRRLIAVAAMTDYNFAECEPWNKFFNMSPEELAKLAAANAASGGGGGEAEKEEEPEEEEEADVGAGGMFGDDDGY